MLAASSQVAPDAGVEDFEGEVVVGDPEGRIAIFRIACRAARRPRVLSTLRAVHVSHAPLKIIVAGEDY